jgi:hypothetical protein
MGVLLDLIGTIAARAAGGGKAGGRLDALLRRWWEMREREGGSPSGERPAPPSSVLLLGVLTWTRLHGIVTLELAGIVGDMGLDAGLLVQAELDAVVAAAAGADH